MWVTHFWTMLPFYTLWKHQKIFGFLVFWGGIKLRTLTRNQLITLANPKRYLWIACICSVLANSHSLLDLTVFAHNTLGKLPNNDAKIAKQLEIVVYHFFLALAEETLQNRLLKINRNWSRTEIEAVKRRKS